MTTEPFTEQQQDDRAVQVLSISGAMCGVCGDEPGDRNCADCERVRRGYIADLRAAGWAPKGDALRELADRVDPQRPEISFFGDHGHVIGEWMRKQAEYADRRVATQEAGR